MINYTELKTVKIYRIYNSNGTPQGYFLSNEKEMAERYAETIGGSIKIENIYCLPLLNK